MFRDVPRARVLASATRCTITAADIRLVRSIELLLGMPPLSQYDAAATPYYAAFGTTPDLTPFNKLAPQVDLEAKNNVRAYGAQASKKMDFDDVDRNPPFLLNEIIWRSVKGENSPMPLPVHRFQIADAPR